MVRRSVPTDRVIVVLEWLAANGGEPVSLAEIARGVDMAKATCHAILLSLTESGYVVREEDAKSYVLGPALVGLGRAAEKAYPFVPELRGLVHELLEESGYSCVVTAVSGDSIVVLDHDGDARIDYLRRGNRVPFAAPYGIVHAAWASEATRRQWLKRGGEATRGRGEEMNRLTAEVRARGFSVSPLDAERMHLRELLALVKRDILSEDLRRLIERTSGPIARDYLWDEIRGERFVPVSTISSPVLDGKGRVRFAMHLQVLDLRVSPAAIRRHAKTLTRTTELAAQLIATAATRDVPALT